MTVAELEEIFATGQNNSRFEVNEGKHLYRITQPGEISQYWTIAVCNEALDFRGSHFEAGDLLMMLYDKNGEIVYNRHVRRMQ